MRRLLETVLSTLFLCSPVAVAHAQAQARFPATGALQLPSLSTTNAAAMHVVDVALSVTFTDGAGKQLVGATKALLKWRDGAWRVANGTVLTQLLLPATFLEGISGVKPYYTLDYTVGVQVGSSSRSVVLTESLALSDDLRATAEFPLQPVTIDGSDLDWEVLVKVAFRIESRFGGVPVNHEDALRRDLKRADGGPASRTGTVIARIYFTCVSGKVLAWPDNVKDLRALPSGLDVRLTQPACTK